MAMRKILIAFSTVFLMAASVTSVAEIMPFKNICLKHIKLVDERLDFSGEMGKAGYYLLPNQEAIANELEAGPDEEGGQDPMKYFGKKGESSIIALAENLCASSIKNITLEQLEIILKKTPGLIIERIRLEDDESDPLRAYEIYYNGIYGSIVTRRYSKEKNFVVAILSNKGMFDNSIFAEQLRPLRAFGNPSEDIINKQGRMFRDVCLYKGLQEKYFLENVNILGNPPINLEIPTPPFDNEAKFEYKKHKFRFLHASSPAKCCVVTNNPDASKAAKAVIGARYPEIRFNFDVTPTVLAKETNPRMLDPTMTFEQFDTSEGKMSGMCVHEESNL